MAEDCRRLRARASRSLRRLRPAHNNEQWGDEEWEDEYYEKKAQEKRLKTRKSTFDEMDDEAVGFERPPHTRPQQPTGQSIWNSMWDETVSIAYSYSTKKVI